jgi:ATP-dependent helicase/nuclease subunit A
MTSAAHVPQDAAARERAVEEPGSVLVQAPAGSGKTTLLTQRYLRLLAAVDAPERILALTFTRRAAQEMRDRVVLALSAGRLPECPADQNGMTWQLAAAAVRHLDALKVDLEQHPARLRIETIDAFNAWLAAQLPVSAGTGSRLNLLEKVGPLYEEAARRALAHDDDDAFGRAVERVLAADDQRYAKLAELIAAMLPGRDRWLRLLAGRLGAASALDDEQLRRARQLLDEDLELLVTRALRDAHEAVGGLRIAALSALLAGAAARLDGQRADFAAWRHDTSALRPATAHLARWRGLLAAVLTKDGTIRKRVAAPEGFPPRSPDKQPMQDLLQELAREPRTVRTLKDLAALPEPCYSDLQWERVRDVAQVLVLAAGHLDQVFRERGAVDFPAVAMAALRALGSPLAPTDLGLRLDYRLRHILVDEFQDTSGTQLELLRLLTAGWQQDDGRSVFCVGDPMQSIYGFRQAEVRAFLELADEGIGDLRFDVQRLSSNFRSAAPVVDWINATFARILPQTDNRDRGAIAYRPSTAPPGASAAAAGGVSLQGFATRRDEARAIAAAIGAATARHPEWRIAVLVRARSHAGEIAARLREREVAFRAVDIEPLAERAVVRDLLALLRALLHLGDRTAWLALLRAPWAGLSLADLLTVARAAPIVWEALADDSVLAAISYAGRLRCERVRGVLAAAFAAQDRGDLTRWVERTWLALGGPACAESAADLVDAHAAFARLRALDQRGLPDPAVIAAHFADLYAAPGAPSAVEIMTIHKAKGLEFDMVVLPALDRAIAHHTNPFLLSHQFARAHRDGMAMAARPPLGTAPDPLFEFLRRQARDAAGLEAERLLYVACTRAKSQLLLSAVTGDAGAGDETDTDAAEGESPATDASRGSKPWTPRAGSLLFTLWPVAGPQFEAHPPPTAGTSARADPDSGHGGALRRLPAVWSPVPVESPLPVAATAVDRRDRVPTPVFDWAGETARHVGSLVHAELQTMDLGVQHEQAIRDRDPLYRRWLALRGIPRDRLQEASARVIAALIEVQRDPRGRWILGGGRREDLREHAVSGLWHGEILRVIFDRSFIDDAGMRWIVDYKTSRHLGGGLDEFLDSEVERYRGQMQRYAALARRMGPEPVRVGLYFPLMRGWREWTP